MRSVGIADGGLVMRKTLFSAVSGVGLLASLIVALAGPAYAADIPVMPPPVVVAPMAEQPAPRFYALLGALFVTRTTPAPAPILLEAPDVFALQAPLPDDLLFGDILDASDLDFGWTFGLYARAGMIMPGNIGFEAGGFWLRPMTSAVAAAYVDPIYVILGTDPGMGISDIEAFTSINTTQLYGLDVNAVFQPNAGPLQIYGGLAFLQLRDAFDLTLTQNDGFVVTTYPLLWETSNRLIGPQIGARFFLGSGDPFSVTIDAKVGYLRNAYTNDFLGFDFDGDPIIGEDSGKLWSFMAQGGITANYALSENLHLNVGYQAIFLNNVALAPHQVGATDGPLPNGPGSVKLNTYTSHVLFHGVSAGLTLFF